MPIFRLLKPSLINAIFKKDGHTVTMTNVLQIMSLYDFLGAR